MSFSNPWDTWRDVGFAVGVQFAAKQAAHLWRRATTDWNAAAASDLASSVQTVATPLDALHNPPPDALQACWVGHATAVVQLGGSTVVVDPVWSDSVPPAVARATGRPFEVEQLTGVDAVLVSHNHYDHLDAATVARFRDAFDPLFLVPQGLKAWFEAEMGRCRCREMSWWETVDVGSLHVHFVPAQHWSRRSLFDTNKSWWGGWVIKCDSPSLSVYHAGDTGYCPVFTEIGSRLGPFDLSFIPIGPIEPRELMVPQHVDPEEAVQIHKDVGSRRSVPIHWATFGLGTDMPGEPARRLVLCCAVSPDGSRVVSGSRDKTLRLWDSASGSLIAILAGHTGPVTCCTVSPDGSTVVSGSMDRTLRNGKEVLSGSHDGTVMLWDMASGSPISTLAGHSGPVTACAMSPDGSTVVSGSDDKTLRLWDTASASLVATQDNRTGPITCCAFLPDGERVVSGSDDSILRLWGTDAQCGCGPLTRSAQLQAALEEATREAATAAQDEKAIVEALEQELQDHRAKHKVLQQDLAWARERETRASAECAEAQLRAQEALRKRTALKQQSVKASQQAMKLSRVVATRYLSSLEPEMMPDVLAELGLGAYSRAFFFQKMSGDAVAESSTEELLCLGLPTTKDCKHLQHALRTMEACGLLRLTQAAIESRTSSQELSRASRDALETASWSAERVSLWLKSNGIGEDERAKIRDAGIEGEHLIHLDAQDLERLGVAALGDRKRVAKEIKHLRESLFAVLKELFQEKKLEAAAANQGPEPAGGSSAVRAPPVEVPPEYKCPITLEVMEDPVVAQDGYIYEGRAIRKWLETHATAVLLNLLIGPVLPRNNAKPLLRVADLLPLPLDRCVQRPQPRVLLPFGGDVSATNAAATQPKSQYPPALAGHPDHLPWISNPAAPAAPRKHEEQQQHRSLSSPQPHKHHDALDTTADLGATIEAQKPASRAADEDCEEYKRRIEILEAALCASDQRRREAEEESRRTKELYDEAQRELDGAVSQVAAITDRLGAGSAQIRAMACLEYFDEATRRRTSQRPGEVEAPWTRDSESSRALNAELEARRAEDAAPNLARSAQLEAQMAGDAALSHSRIAQLEAELADAHRERDAAEARSQSNTVLADELRAELLSAVAHATALSRRVEDDGQRIAELTDELARARGALGAAAHAVARADQGQRLARRLCMRLCEMERALDEAQATSKGSGLSYQRRREAEEESRHTRELYDKAQRELDGAVAQVALADRLAACSAHSHDMACFESFDEVTRTGTSQHLTEIEALGEEDASASQVRITEDEAKRAEDAAMRHSAIALAEAQRGPRTAASQTMIAKLEAEGRGCHGEHDRQAGGPEGRQ
eukprot:m51a1_g1345 hypothetical protein (1350) ;mRNA; r:329526-337986